MRNSKGIILIADDEEYLRESTSEFVNALFPNYDTEAFSDGVQLKQRLENSVEKVSAVLTDNNMQSGPAGIEGPKGIDLIKEYFGREGFPPFVLITGDEQGAGREAEKYGAFYLAKPYNLNQFKETVEKALNGSG